MKKLDRGINLMKVVIALTLFLVLSGTGCGDVVLERAAPMRTPTIESVPAGYEIAVYRKCSGDDGLGRFFCDWTRELVRDPAYWSCERREP